MSWSQFDSNGNQKVAVSRLTYNTRTVSTSTLITGDDHIVFLDTSVGPAFTVTLPSAIGLTGVHFIFIDISNNANNFNVTIDGNGAETINGAATYVIDIPREVLSIVSNGTSWFST